MEKTQRFDWNDHNVKMFEDALDSEMVLVFDHVTGIAYVGEMIGGTQNLANEVAEMVGGHELELVDGTPLFQEGV